MTLVFIFIQYMLRLNPERLVTQVVRADLASYFGSKLKLEQEEGLKGVSFLFFNEVKNTSQRNEDLLLNSNMCLVKWLGQAIIKDCLQAGAWGIYK